MTGRAPSAPTATPFEPATMNVDVTNLASLRAAVDSGRRVDVFLASMVADGSLSAMAQLAGAIRTAVIGVDGLGDPLGSLAELGLRAVRMIVLVELDNLRDVLCSPSACGRAHALHWWRSRGIDDFEFLVRCAVDRVTAAWAEHRGVEHRDRGAYRSALRAAHEAMRALGELPGLSRFLRDGAARGDWPALAAICTRLQAALRLRIAIEPDQPLFIPAALLGERATTR